MLLPNDTSRRWEILSTEYLIRRPWLTARRDKVRLPDGRINPEYYVVEYPDWVTDSSSWNGSTGTRWP